MNIYVYIYIYIYMYIYLYIWYIVYIKYIDIYMIYIIYISYIFDIYDIYIYQTYFFPFYYYVLVGPTCSALVLWCRFVSRALLCCTHICGGQERGEGSHTHTHTRPHALYIALMAYLWSGAVVCRVERRQRWCAGRPGQRGYLHKWYWEINCLNLAHKRSKCNWGGKHFIIISAVCFFMSVIFMMCVEIVLFFLKIYLNLLVHFRINLVKKSWSTDTLKVELRRERFNNFFLYVIFVFCFFVFCFCKCILIYFFIPESI